MGYGNSQLTFTCSKSTVETLKKRCEICSKLTIKTPEHVSDVVLVFLLLTLNIPTYLPTPFDKKVNYRVKSNVNALSNKPNEREKTANVIHNEGQFNPLQPVLLF